MNTKNNQRARETVERIIRTVYRKIADEHKPVSRITVREVCEAAEINRSTFYAHFRDVYDVVERVEKQMSENLTRSVLDRADRARNIGELFEEVFAFVGEYREFYRIYFRESNAGVIGVAWELLSDRTTKLSYRELGYRNQREMEYQGAFFIHGITAMLRLWLEADCPETPREMVDVVVRQYAQDRRIFEWWNAI